MLAAVLISGFAGCARTTIDNDPTLHPPGEKGAAPAVAGETVIRDLSRYDFLTAYPKRFIEQKVAFGASCDMSARSADKGVEADAKLLRKLFNDAKSPEDFASSLQGEFELVQVAVNAAAPSTVPSGILSGKDGMLTGYATPEVLVRSKPDERFRFPIVGDIRKSHPELIDKPRRELIASPAVRESAIAWVDDPLAWALIETNGSARLTFEDSGVEKGKSRRTIVISRVATNGKPWTSIGRWLANRGLVDSSTYTFADVAREAGAHPDKTEAAALDNERVVFFAVVSEAAFPPPIGVSGGGLMAGYSCAADQSIYPAGSVLVVVERDGQAGVLRPARFLFVHDAGGAIAGPGRVDVYFGEGTDALLKAGQARTPIEIFRLRRR